MSADGAQTILAVSDLSKTFGSFVSKKVAALQSVTFSLEKGEICGLVGPNGAGKSTLINIIMGGVRKDKGSITVESTKAIGYVPDRPIFYEDLTALDNLILFAEYNKIGDPKDVCRKLLDEFGLGDRGDEPVRNYSKGMKQRLAIARALIHEPGFLIMDEPFTGLDPTMVIDLRNAIMKLKGSGLTILLSSHDLHEMNNICDSVVFIKSGQIVNKESMAECHETVDVQFTVLNPTSSMFACLDGYPTVRRSGDGKIAVVRMRKDEVPQKVVELVRVGGLLQEVRLLEKSVEDLYSELIMEGDRK